MQLNHLFKRAAWLILGGAAFLLHNCDVRPTTMGYQNRIFVVVDSLVWEDVKTEVVEVFHSAIKTPHVENSFSIERIPLQKLNGFKERMNIFLIGLENGKTETDEYIRSNLPEKFKQGVRDDKYFYLFKDDMFARNQIGIIMYAKDAHNFNHNFSVLKNEIFETFRKKYYARLKEGMYSKGEQTKIEEYLADNYGWKVRVQHDYFIANQDKDDHFIWLRRVSPNRWLSVWKVKGDSSLLDSARLFDIRDRFTGKYYEGDHVVREDSYFTETLFNGNNTKRIIGLWQNDSLLVGGPFRTYLIYNLPDSSLYFIDYAVMAPGKLKQPFLDQLEVMARTFEIVDKKN